MRFIPRGESQALAPIRGPSGRQPFDRPWYRFLRQLGIDLDSVTTDLATHEALTDSAHGWTALTDQAITTGANSIAHGLSTTPTQVMMVKDLAPPCMVEAYNDDSGGAQSIGTGGSETTVELNAEGLDVSGDFDTTTYTLTVPHTGRYFVSWRLALTGFASGQWMYGRLAPSSSTGLFGDFEHGSLNNLISSSGSAWISLTAAETVTLEAYQTSGSSQNVRAGLDDTRLHVRSDDSWSMGTHDATNITIYSARARTMSFLVR